MDKKCYSEFSTLVLIKEKGAISLATLVRIRVINNIN